MQKIVLIVTYIGFVFCSNVAKGTTVNLNGKVPVHWTQTDDEYDRYKKRADDFFDKGDYQNALRQYRNCLEVPAYENDPYAKGRIALVEKLIKLRQDAYQSLNAGKGEEAIGFFEKIVVENPKDSITKVSLTDYWTGEANRFYEQQNYEEAKIRYQKALPYATKPALIQMQIRNSEVYIKQKADLEARTAVTKPKDPATLAGDEPEKKTVLPGKMKPENEIRSNRRIGMKLLVGAVGLGAGAYAYTLNNQYQTKLDEVNRIGKATDPDGDNIILTSGEYSQWQKAYQETMDSKKNRSKFVASLGVVGAAAITEVILLVLPKKKKLTGFSVGASDQNVGLAVRYTFR